MFRAFIIAIALLIPAIASGQISVPAESEEYVPIPVSIKTDIPDGARTTGPGWILPPGLNRYDVGPNSFVVCGPPGEYTLQFSLKWLHIVPVTFKDGAGNDITIQSYLGDGTYEVKATFKIKGKDGPDPPPPPPPPVPGERKAVILEESKERTAAQAALQDALRPEFPGGKLQILDDDQPEAQKYLSAVPANVRPALIVLQRDQVVRALACPTTVDAVKAEVAK